VSEKELGDKVAKIAQAAQAGSSVLREVLGDFVSWAMRYKWTAEGHLGKVSEGQAWQRLQGTRFALSLGWKHRGKA
jgi:hypothetical protein